jgi:hypothetical protein
LSERSTTIEETMSTNMSDKVRASTKVSPPSTAAKPVAPRQQTSMTPAASNTLGGRVRPLTQVASPAPEVQGHAPPTPYPYKRPTPEPVRGHATQAVLADTRKLTPSLAAGIRKATAAK